MPELNPRRVASTKGRFAQVTAAVLAGMAAMFCLQNVIEFRREKALLAAPALAPAAPAEPEPDIALPAPEGVKRQAGPAASSMMLKPEPGLSPAEASVVGVSGEEAPPRYEAPPPPPPPEEEKKAMPHLQDRAMESKFASSAVRNDGRFSKIKRRVIEKAAPKKLVAAAPVPRPVVGASGIKMIERPAAAPEHLQPAPIAQLSTLERVFWTKERAINVGIALILLIGGLLYLAYASGIFHNEAPERSEGEL